MHFTMYSHIFVVIFCGSILAVTSHPSIDQRNDLMKRAEKANMQYLGVFGDKAFFMDDIVKTNWMGGRERCRNEGFQHAVFKNREEYRYVYDVVPIGTQIWVGASVKGMETYATRSTFEWSDGNGTEVTYEFSFWHYPAHWLCLIFSRDDHLYTDFCLSGNHGTLCQLPMNSNQTIV